MTILSSKSISALHSVIVKIILNYLQLSGVLLEATALKDVPLPTRWIHKSKNGRMKLFSDIFVFGVLCVRVLYCIWSTMCALVGLCGKYRIEVHNFVRIYT